MFRVFHNIVTNMTIARQQFGKQRLKAKIVEPEQTSIAEQRIGENILEVTQSTVGPPLLGSKSLNTDTRDNGRIN
jgi:hypothetical protein